MSIDEELASVLTSATVAGPASEEAVLSAEAVLGVRFPDSYRTFLREYGAVVGPEFEIAGICPVADDAPPMWRNVVLVSEQSRRVGGQHLSPTLIPISDDGCGLTYYIEASENGAVEDAQVIAIGPGVDEVVVADGFRDFVTRLAAGPIEIPG